jgi:hypothetical protein
MICVLSSTANGQLQSQQEYKNKTNKNIQGRNKETNRLRLFIFKLEFLKKVCRFTNCIGSRNTSSGRQCLEEQVNIVRLRMFLVAINQILLLLLPLPPPPPLPLPLPPPPQSPSLIIKRTFVNKRKLGDRYCFLQIVYVKSF